VEIVGVLSGNGNANKKAFKGFAGVLGFIGGGNFSFIRTTSFAQLDFNQGAASLFLACYKDFFG